jgi:hypothetical protein
MKWQKLDKKPVEKRNIEHPARGSRGRLEMWIDIIRPMDKQPPTVIFPKVQLPYELRVIVWESQGLRVSRMKCPSRTTCLAEVVSREVRTGKRLTLTGSAEEQDRFNWRWKWEVNLPVDMNKNYGEDRFNFQLWDQRSHSFK